MATSATMTTMAYEPDPATAKLFAQHKQAAQTIKRTRKPVLGAAEQAIRQGATNPQLAELTGMSDETFRKMAERLGIDNRTKAPTTGPEAAARLGKNTTAPTAPAAPRHPALGQLTPTQISQAAARAWPLADADQYQALTAAAERGDRAVVETALHLGLLHEDNLRAL